MPPTLSSICRLSGPRRAATGFTIPEVLVVIGVIAVLIAVLFPALRGGYDTAQMAKAESGMKEIFKWLQLYSHEHRDVVLPSEFNYQDPANPANPAGGYPIKVRSDSRLGATPWGQLRYRGTWADILWTFNDLGEKYAIGASFGARFRFDAPEADLYDGNVDEDPIENTGGEDSFILRSPAANTRNSPTGNGPTPFGTGAKEQGYPGFFAANNFFNQDPTQPVQPGDPPMPTTGRWWGFGQIKAPERSMYLVDSWAGETIEPVVAAYDNTGNPSTCEVDFRYNDACLMLFLDGHVDPVPRFTDLDDLQTTRRIKIQDLHRN